MKSFASAVWYAVPSIDVVEVIDLCESFHLIPNFSCLAQRLAFR